MIKIIKQLLFITLITIGASCAAFAQNKDDKKTPPKGIPPVVVVKQKEPEKPKDEKPKNDGVKPKKPQSEMPGALQVVGIMFN